MSPSKSTGYLNGSSNFARHKKSVQYPKTNFENGKKEDLHKSIGEFTNGQMTSSQFKSKLLRNGVRVDGTLINQLIR